MRIGDTEAIYRPEPMFLGDKNGKHEFPFDARFRSQVLAVGLLVALAPTGYQLMYAAMSWAGWLAQTSAAVVFGAGGGALVSVLLTRAYGKHDKPQTRLDYWAEQAWGLATSPRPPGPPVEHEVTAPRHDPRGAVTGIMWQASTPPSLTEKWDKEN